MRWRTELMCMPTKASISPSSIRPIKVCSMSGDSSDASTGSSSQGRPRMPAMALSSAAASSADAMHDGPQMPSLPHIGMHSATRTAGPPRIDGTKPADRDPCDDARCCGCRSSEPNRALPREPSVADECIASPAMAPTRHFLVKEVTPGAPMLSVESDIGLESWTST